MRVRSRATFTGLSLAVILCGPLFLDAEQHASAGDFILLMRTVSDGWNEGNARKPADCFSDDAVYQEPPDRQLFMGREALFRFFGGTNPARIMHMEWHHLAFNEEDQVGYGEYTFQGSNRYHGIVTVLIKNGRIAKWREYQYKSATDWDDFTGKSRF